MSFWSGDKLVANKEIISDFDESNIEANSYSLHMGEYYFRTYSEDDNGPRTTKSVKDGESFIIPAGQFAHLITKESVSIPSSAMAFISVRATIKLQGLIDISGFHIDPGYSGNLIFAVFNAGPSPIHLFGGEPIFKIWLADLE